ncbi:MAG TPA: MFS transporter [Anaerolineales bacterium]
MLRRMFTGLWRQPDFLKLWAGETISLLGSQVTLLAMPLVAVLSLNATPFQMGILGMVQYIPWLLIGLAAGAWVDRMHRRPVLVAADLGRALLLGFIPFAAVAGILKLEYLYGIAFLVGILNVFFDVAYTAFLPTLVPRNRLLEGNSKLQVSASIAEIAGPGIAGGLVQWLTAPLAIVADAISFLVSAVSLAWIGASEPGNLTADGSRNILVEIREGLRLIFLNPILRTFAIASMTCNFFIDVHLAVFVLYAMRGLEISPVTLDAIYAVGSLGGLLGSVFAGRLATGLGLGRAIVGMQILLTFAMAAIPLSGMQTRIAVPVIALAEAVWGFATVVYVVNTVSLRQVITPDRLQGRAAASLRFVTWGVAPLGFLLGGILGEQIGLKATLLVSVCGPLLSIVFLILSPVPRLRRIPASEPAVEPPVSPA